MPRTKGGSKYELDPENKWEKLQYVEQLICYNYYLWTATQGKEGWNPRDAGSVYHRRSSNFIASSGSKSWFRHKALAMVTLAEAFQKINKAPPKPVQPPTPEGAAEQQQPPPQAKRRVGSPPRPTLKQTAAALSLKTPPRVPQQPKNSTPKTPRSNSMAPFIPEIDLEGSDLFKSPTTFGVHKKFSYETRSSTYHILCRVIMHNAVEKDDLLYEWVTPRQLLVRIRWPIWFQEAEQMAEFTVDDEGRAVFPPEHEVTIDTAERNQLLVEEDGRIWDEGVLKFKQDMSTSMDIIEILNVQSPSGVVKVLQIYCAAAPMVSSAKSSGQKVKQVRKVTIGDGSRGQKRSTGASMETEGYPDL